MRQNDNTITVTFSDHSTRTVPIGTVVGDLLPASKDGQVIVAAKVNNYITSLSYSLEVHSTVAPTYLGSPEGLRVYRRSLSFLLAIAARAELPDRRLVIGHSLGDSYYYMFDDEEPVTDELISRLTATMHSLVKQDLNIDRRILGYQEALDHFRTHWMSDTARLLENRNDHKISVYQCGDFIDLGHEPLASSTSVLKQFELMRYGEGFLLRYPNSANPTEMSPFEDNPLLFSIYEEYKEWGEVLGITSAGKLNQLVRSPKVKDFIWTAEALHNKKISEIADKIADRYNTVRMVLIAGPSSSGKTTFTKKLAIQLRVIGLEPVIINLDDYFINRADVLLDEDGRPDYEALEVIDIDLLNDDLLKLASGNEVNLPTFDFKTGVRVYENRFVHLPERGIIVMEGIHALNGGLTPRILAEQKFKIYISALTQLNLDDHTRVSTTDNRLIRRMVRDAQFRGYSARETLEMWPSVRRGERRNIFPFQNEADSAFNSALDYELSILRNYAEPLLREVKPYDSVYHEAVRLMSFLDNFTPIHSADVPDQSILREFIGASAFTY
ncbi:MAG: nucleoside kinase [Spirochaetota bacterium]